MNKELIDIKDFESLYNLIETYIFGGVVDVGTYQELITIAISAFGCLFVVALPFFLIIKVIKML